LTQYSGWVTSSKLAAAFKKYPVTSSYVSINLLLAVHLETDNLMAFLLRRASILPMQAEGVNTILTPLPREEHAGGRGTFLMSIDLCL
jgi:hypothetical protein